jgi:subtilisin family serine protease
MIKLFLFSLVMGSLLHSQQSFAHDYLADRKISAWSISSTVSPNSIKLDKIPSFPLKKEIVVAVIDTGIDEQHPYLSENIVGSDKKKAKQANFGVDVSHQPVISYNPKDTHGHGTHVAGIIKSIAPQVRILPIKFYQANAKGNENLKATLFALKYAIEANVDIINYSAGGPYPSAEELALLKQAEAKGILVVAAAGNDAHNIDQKSHTYYPAAYHLANMISVTAHNQQGKILKSSNWGKNLVDISAPGEQILSSLPNNKQGEMTGTSQATAFVTGVAVLIKSQYPNLTAPDIKSIIIKSAEKKPDQSMNNLAGGILNAPDALNLAKNI